MSSRSIRWIVWTTVAVSFSLNAIGVWLQAVTGLTAFNLGLPFMIATSVFLVSLTVIGAVIATWHPHNLVGWLLFANVITWGPQSALFGLIAYWLEFGSGVFPGLNVALVWLSWTGEPFMLLILTLLFLHFPNGRLPSRRWRYVVWAAIAGLVGRLILDPLEPREVDPALGLASPLAVDPSQWAVIEPIYVSVIAVSLVCLFAAATSLILRFRRSRGVERQQLKWIAFSAVPVILAFPWPGYFSDDPTSPEVFWSGLALIVSLFGMAIAIALAIFRYRLWDIDLVIRRTLVYTILTGCLGLIYLAGVVTVQGLLAAQSEVAVVMTTLLVAALFSPLRGRIQDFIDRRFYRKKYDADLILRNFASTARDEVDLDELTARLVQQVGRAMQPKFLSIWLSNGATQEGETTG